MGTTPHRRRWRSGERASGRRAAEMGMLSTALSATIPLFFDALRDLLKPGPTGTNVNDLILLAGL
jgi:glycerate-2-kinase